jgi:hypothetical protein
VWKEGGGPGRLTLTPAQDEAAKAKADNAKIAADNEKLAEGDPARKPLHEVPVVPEFTSKEIKDKPGKDGKVIGVKVIRIR